MFRWITVKSVFDLSGEENEGSRKEYSKVGFWNSECFIGEN